MVAGRVGGDLRIENVRLIGRVYNIFPNPEGAGPVRATLRRRVDALLQRHQPFGGRHNELEALDTAAADPAGGYVFLTAPSGFGKTALLANWTIRAGDAHHELVYHFINREEGVADEQFTLLSLCQQLVAIHGLTGELPVLTPELRVLASLMLATPPPDGRRVTVVLDGLDEALGWTPGPDLFPDLPFGVCVILSAREVADGDWLQRLRLEPERVRRLSLGALRDAEITEVFQRTGDRATAYAADPELREGVAAASGGDPFYVRLLAEDIQQGEHQDGAAPPSGLHAYLARWWEELAADVDIEPKEAYDLLGFLTVARGPLRVSDLTRVSESLRRGALVKRELGGKLRRYLIGSATAGYALCHSRFRRYLEEEVFEAETEGYRADLVAYCARWRETRSAYALSYYAAHLAEAGDADALVALIDWPWLDARLEQERSYRGFAADVDVALTATLPPDSYDDVVRAGRLCLARATAASLATEVSDDALVALAHVGREEEALAYVELMTDAPRMVAVLRRCGAALTARGAPEAETLVERALEVATAVPASRALRWNRANALVALAGAFDAAGARDRADEVVAQAWAAEDADAVGLASDLVRAGRLDQAADALNRTTDARRAASPRAALVRALVDRGDYDAAVQTCLAVEHSWRRVPQLVAVIDALARAGARDTAERAALELARAGDAAGDGWSAAPLLGQVARGLARLERLEEAQATWDRAMACLPEGDPIERAWAVAGVARACAQAGELGQARELAAVLDHLEAPDGPAAPRSINYATAATWREIARCDARRGHVDSATAALRRAQAAALAAEQGPTNAVRLETPDLRDDEWTREPADDVIAALAEGGEVKAALEAAVALAGAQARDRALNRVIEALLELGDHGRAKDVADRVVDHRARADAYGRIAVVLATDGDPQGERLADEALRLAHANNAPWTTSWATVSVVKVFAAVRPDRAQAVLEDITALDVRAWAAVSLARARLAAGDAEGGARWAEHAADLAANLAQDAEPPEPVARSRTLIVPDSDHIVMEVQKRPRVLSPLAERAFGGGLHVGSVFLPALSNPISLLLPHVVDVLLRAGQQERAAEVALGMLDTAVGLQDRIGPASWTALQTTVALARLGRFQEALSVASRIPTLVLRVQADAAVADTMVQAGLADGATEPLRRAIEGLQESHHVPQYDEMAIPVVATLLRLGQVDRAIEAAGSRAALVQLLLKRPGRLADVAYQLAGGGHREAAESLVAEAQHIAGEDPGHLADVAEALGKLGSFEEEARAVAEARASAAKHENPEAAADVLTRLTDLLAERGVLHAARDTLQDAARALPGISDVQARDRMRSAIAFRLAEHESGAAARALLRDGDRPAARAEALQQVVTILAGRGLETDAAEVASETAEVADSASDPEEGSGCWTSAAFALAASGQGGEAVLALLNAWLSASRVSRGVLLDVLDRSAVIVNGIQNGIEPGDILWALHRGALDIDAWWSSPTGHGEAGAAKATA